MGVDRHELEVQLADHLLVFAYQARPGVIGVLGQALGVQGVNIAGMDVSRDDEGAALAVLTLDGALSAATGDTLAAAIGAARAAEVDLSV